MSVRIGCYVCHCGINIAAKVRVEEVAAFARTLSHVTVARDYKFMCSDPGQAMIEADIAELRLNRVVVASCSPRLHAKTFMQTCERAGLNPYYFQMASVREQVSWVTVDADAATAKAKSLVAAALSRVIYHEPLTTREASVNPNVMVVGGGIAGMQAALDIGAAGHHVYLVERDTTIGGHMLQFDKTFPTLDCAACIGTPKMVEVAQSPNIELFSLSEVTDVSGFIGNYTVTVRKQPRYVDAAKCTGCGECAGACPVSLPNSWDEGMGTRKAIGRAFPQSIPITFNIEKRDRAPCVGTCPAGVNVQGYVQLIRKERYEQALQLIRQRLPLPGVLGRVCPHPCENSCRRSEVDAPLAIRALKRFAADQAGEVPWPRPTKPENAKPVAVIGSGPSGLSVAAYLRLKGYPVTIFEALNRLGGMLRVGIPDYRLPPDLLDAEIQAILDLGITVRTGLRFGENIDLETLAADGFEAVFLGLGAHDAMRLGLPGENTLVGLVDAVTFLRDANIGGLAFRKNAYAARRVAVIGGGNVAVDAARMLIRLGARSVQIVYRRSVGEMPAYPEEIQAAREEGIVFRCLTVPVGLVSSAGRVVGLECLRTELGHPDASGRHRPVPVDGSQFILECDLVVPAIGQMVAGQEILAKQGLALTPQGSLRVAPDTGQSNLPHVFAAGDAVTGPATVIEAVGAAHRVVAAMDAFLQDRALPTPQDQRTDASHTPDWDPVDTGLPAIDRAVEARLPVAERCTSFAEVEKGLAPDQAKAEAERCLNCGACCECMACTDICEVQAIDHTMSVQTETVQVGSIILATGYGLLDPTPLTPYGYGIFPNVFTALEFERLSNATGPTGGQILLRDAKGDFTRPPDSVALLHCIGSRDRNHHPYCSRVCCMYALKYTHLIKEKVGHATRVYDFYIDMRCFGEGYEEFYQRCQEEGTLFIRGKVAEVSAHARTKAEEGHLVCIAEDTLLGRAIRVPVEMVILCTAMEARSDAAQVGRIFGVNQGADGFFLEEHPKLGPLNTATDGVFLAGCCQKPMDIPDTVAQASGAAAKALSLATRGKVAVPPTVSWIDPDVCSGCQVCIDLCAYGAITYNPRRMVSEVNPALCKGCGSCSGFCPNGAAASRHFTNRQMYAEIDGLMDALVSQKRDLPAKDREAAAHFPSSGAENAPLQPEERRHA
ncbi:MAG: FAD-dependent oxidoreductase [Desulfosarcinaceae bacterium]|nr:FAD-dependent oxidoreductase [Desulfosarcinaceae bacterium]